MKIKEIQSKLYEKLKPSGWGDKLKLFLLSKDFEQILTHLYNESQDGRKFTPVLKDLFRAFEECPYNNLKIVIIGQDPYPQAGVADGISFSCSHTGKVQPSLRYIFKEIEETVYPDGMTWDPDLKRWSNQGILMLNTAMTCEIGNIGSHIQLWEPFTSYLLDVLDTSNTGLVYVYLGNKAKAWNKSTGSINYKFFIPHPASAAYRKGSKWETGDVFNKINNIMHKNYGERIVW
jgi:uracil-DNA glycosylase